MHLVSPVHGCEQEVSARYAIIPLDPTFARTALAWRELLLRAKAAHPELFRISLLHARAHWLTAQPPATDPIITGRYEDIELALQASLGADGYAELINSSLVSFPDETPLPTRFEQDTEYDSIDVTEDGLRFRSYPRHDTSQEETDVIPWSHIEQAAVEQTPNPPTAIGACDAPQGP